MIELREYQRDALCALNTHLKTKNTNPCIVIPTGGGKSIMIASAISQWRSAYPPFRCAIIAHRKELVEQNYEEFCQIDCEEFKLDYGVGIFCASLGIKEYDARILFASIDSIYKRAGDFEPFDVIMVDEAHRIPPKGEGKYLTFIKESRRFNQHLRVVGWTATPYRLSSGPLCHRDHLLNEICYEIGVDSLINQGFLCPLRSKVGDVSIDLSDVRRNYSGDYISSSLAETVNQNQIVSSAIDQALAVINSHNRKSVIFFCVDIEHCQSVSQELARRNFFAPVVTSKTDSHTRTSIAKEFKNGTIRGVCNVNVYTEGFNATGTDCIVLLRPTLSKGLFSQMVGRGLRMCYGKDYCLVLDFANCIDEHGPIDRLECGYTAMAVCGQCRESFSRATGRCPICGWILPKLKRDELDEKEKERERKLHGDKLSEKSILASEPSKHKVDDVYIRRHTKTGKPDSLLVQYRCGAEMFREWVCLDHDGYAEQQAAKWWEMIFCDKTFFTKVPRGKRVSHALSLLLLRLAVIEVVKSITIIQEGKYTKIIGYNQK